MLSYRAHSGERLVLFTIYTQSLSVLPLSLVNNLLNMCLCFLMKQPMLYRERPVTIRCSLAVQVEHSLIPEVVALIGLKCQVLTQWLRWTRDLITFEPLIKDPAPRIMPSSQSLWNLNILRFQLTVEAILPWRSIHRLPYGTHTMYEWNLINYLLKYLSTNQEFLLLTPRNLIVGESGTCTTGVITLIMEEEEEIPRPRPRLPRPVGIISLI